MAIVSLHFLSQTNQQGRKAVRSDVSRPKSIIQKAIPSRALCSYAAGTRIIIINLVIVISDREPSRISLIQAGSVNAWPWSKRKRIMWVWFHSSHTHICKLVGCHVNCIIICVQMISLLSPRGHGAAADGLGLSGTDTQSQSIVSNFTPSPSLTFNLELAKPPSAESPIPGVY